MTLAHPTIKKKMKAWQQELRTLTKNNDIELFAAEESPIRPLALVQQAVSEATETDLFKVLQRTRKKEVVLVRQLLCYCMRKMCKMTYPTIASLVKYDNHTSVMHCEKEVLERLENGDTQTVSALKKIEKFFESK